MDRLKSRIFLIHWKESEVSEYAERLRALGWQVETEAEDGARAGQRIKEILPDVIVIYLSLLPSHGSETAHALRSMKSTRQIPIVFVDGIDDAVEKTRLKVPDALYTTSENIHSVLVSLSEPRRAHPA
jgi:CheY-like chemotaxis protein